MSLVFSTKKTRLLRCAAAIATLAANLWAPGAQAALGVRNFRQALESLSASTGIDPRTPAIAEYYQLARNRLPKDGRIEEISAPMLLTFTALSGLFCREMIASDSGKSSSSRWTHQGVDFKKGPSALDEGLRREVLGDYAGLFWGRDPSASEMSQLRKLMADVQGRVDGSAASTKSVLLAACTAVAASLDNLVVK